MIKLKHRGFFFKVKLPSDKTPDFPFETQGESEVQSSLVRQFITLTFLYLLWCRLLDVYPSHFLSLVYLWILVPDCIFYGLGYFTRVPFSQSLACPTSHGQVSSQVLETGRTRHLLPSFGPLRIRPLHISLVKPSISYSACNVTDLCLISLFKELYAEESRWFLVTRVPSSFPSTSAFFKCFFGVFFLCFFWKCWCCWLSCFLWERYIGTWELEERCYSPGMPWGPLTPGCKKTVVIWPMPLIHTVTLEFVALEVCLHCVCIPMFMCVCAKICICVVCVCVHKLEVDIRCLPLCSLPCILKVSLNVELADSGRLACR